MKRFLATLFGVLISIIILLHVPVIWQGTVEVLQRCMRLSDDHK